ncbi:MAG: hypothetical protein Q9170_001155 [Blastenia crenularia]
MDLWAVDPRWLDIPLLRGILSMVVDLHVDPDDIESPMISLCETVRIRLLDGSYSLSTFESSMNILNSAHNVSNLIKSLGISQHDVQVRSALAFELMGRNRFLEAHELLYSIFKQIKDGLHHSTSELLPVIIELVKCNNLTGKEREGETIAIEILDNYVEYLTKEQTCGLQIVLADSLFGQKKYERAREILLMVIQNDHMATHTRNITRLRLNKAKRRLGILATSELLDDFGEFLSSRKDMSRAAAIGDAYIDELSATLSYFCLTQKLRGDSSLFTQIALQTKALRRKSSAGEMDHFTESILQDYVNTVAPISSIYSEASVPRVGRSYSSASGPDGKKPRRNSYDSSIFEDEWISKRQMRRPNDVTKVPRVRKRQAQIALHSSNNTSKLTKPLYLGLPTLTVAQGLNWKQMNKDGAKPSLTGSDRLAFLNKRDHIFLIDNSFSMKPHMRSVGNVVSLLAYMLKHSNEDGLDIVFTQTSDKINSRKSFRISSSISQKKFLGISDMRGSLQQIFQEHIKNLGTLVPPPSRSFLRRRDEAHPQRPLSLYVLTDARWQPTDVAGYITDLTHVMEAKRCPKEHVGIQFIRFGEDQASIDKLDELDHGLGLKAEKMDIVDHTYWKDNVWKMLLGALNDWYD